MLNSPSLTVGISNTVLSDRLKAIAHFCIQDYNFTQRLFTNPEVTLREVNITLDNAEMNTLKLYITLFSNKTSSVIFADAGLFDRIFNPTPTQPDETPHGPSWFA